MGCRSSDGRLYVDYIATKVAMGPLFFSRCQQHVGGCVWAKVRVCVGVYGRRQGCAWMRRWHVRTMVRECNGVWDSVRG